MGNAEQVRPTEMSRGSRFVLVVVVFCLVAFGTRTWRLEGQSVGPDEGLSLQQAWGYAPRMLSPGASMPAPSAASPQPPLYYLLLTAFTRQAGGSDFALRFLSVAWALLLVPLLYATGVRFWNRRTGLLAALLGALSPFYLGYAQEARPYTMLAALGLFTIYAMDRGLAERRTVWLVAAFLGAASAVCTHYLGLLLWPVLGAQALSAGSVRRPWRVGIFVALVIAALAGLVAVGYAAPGLESSAQAAPGHLVVVVRLRGIVRSLTVGLAPGRGPSWPVELVCLALFLLGALWPALRRRQVLLGAYFSLPFLTLCAAALIKPVYADSGYAMLASPAFYLGLGRGLERSSRRLWPVTIVAGAVALAGMGAATRQHLAAPPSQARPDYRAAAQAVQLYERPGDVIVLNASENVAAFVHYYRGRLPAINLPPTALRGHQNRLASDQAVASVASRFDRIWLVRRPPTLLEPPGYVEAWLRQEAFLADSTTHGSQGSQALLELYLTRSPLLKEAPPLQHSLQVSFGSLRLEGYDLPLHPVAGGERAWITLYWRPLYSRDLRVSLRLLDDQGRQWGRADEVPYPAYPPQRWPAGSIVRQEASIAVPPAVPPGWYRLELRLYDPQSGHPIEPLPGTEPGPLILGPVRVDATWPRGAPLRRLINAPHILLGGGMRFGEAITLRAYGLEAPSVSPGGWLHADLYWQVVQPPAHDLTLTFELVDGGGSVVCSQSGSPVSDQYPPASWRGGELLWAQNEILIPTTIRPGVYRLRLTIREEGGGELPIRNQWRFWSWGDQAAFLDSVRVVQVPRNFGRPPMERALEARSTAGIDLLGFDGVRERARQGDELEVVLYWRAATVPTKSYKVSVQLLASDRRTVLAQEDSIPAGWARPTTGWSLGEIVSDPHGVAIPVTAGPQTATLIVALYDEDTGQRVQWIDGRQIREYVELCQVEIVD